ncbi:MAG TPA: TIGR03118 family protein [Acidimicrobiia bacterium]
MTLSLALAAPAVGASDGRRHDGRRHDDGYRQTNLISDQAGMAKVQDPNLVNPWGIASGVTMNGPTPFWVSDNGTDQTSIYAGAVHGSPIMQPRPPVSIPGGEPTGQVFNDTGAFKVTSGGKSDTALFIFAAESGMITGWSPNVDANHAVVGASTPNAVYKGIALVHTDDGPRLLATNFHAGTVDVFDSNFMPVTGKNMFVDHHLPAGYAPFNVAVIGRRVFVTYAKQDADAHDDVAGPGHGFIDVYTSEGRFVERFASRGVLDSPWGLVVAPESFGRFGGALLVGNFGNGRINAFDRHGDFLGTLRDGHGMPIAIDGLWGLRFGNGTFSTPGTLVFTAGPDGEMHGLLGTLSANDDD